MNSKSANLEASEARRRERREFFRLSGSAALAVVGAAALAGCSGGGSDPEPEPEPTPTPTPTPTGTPTPGIADPDVMNYLLNLEYLEAQFFSIAVLGERLPAELLTGTGTAGNVRGGRQVTFTDPLVAQYAREIALEERAHVQFLRDQVASYTAAQPTIDISQDPEAGFSQLARAAGLIGEGESFNPYASENNFLLGAFILEDLMVTAYNGALPLFDATVLRSLFGGLLGAEAYHAATIRSLLFERGRAIPALQDATVALSDARDSLDGPEDKDQGVIRGQNRQANIVPANANGLTFARTPGEVLNIVYVNSADVDEGGFFPRGLNGVVDTSDDNA
jgi:hypothetical protein